MRTLMGAIMLFFVTAAFAAGEFTLTSTAFSNHTKIPVVYSCNGKNISPPLSWSNPPANTKSFALTFFSPDPTIKPVFYHWVLYNIPSNVRSLPQGGDLPDGTLAGNNSFGEASYAGPCPPDSLLHHYIFMLYALDTKLNLL